MKKTYITVLLSLLVVGGACKARIPQQLDSENSLREEPFYKDHLAQSQDEESHGDAALQKLQSTSHIADEEDLFSAPETIDADEEGSEPLSEFAIANLIESSLLPLPEAPWKEEFLKHKDRLMHQFPHLSSGQATYLTYFNLPRNAQVYLWKKLKQLLKDLDDQAPELVKWLVNHQPQYLSYQY